MSKQTAKSIIEHIVKHLGDNDEALREVQEGIHQHRMAAIKRLDRERLERRRAEQGGKA